MQLLTSRARAFVYSGMWVAECPRGCKNVEKLFDADGRSNVFYCSNCKALADIEWADDEAGIMAVLELRPIPQNRNWFPTGHDLAVRANLPHGQTVADLVDENREHGVT